MKKFIELITKEMETRNPGMEVSTRTVEKSMQTLTALTVKAPEQQVVPSIYLESFFKKYNEGATIDSIADEIDTIIKDNQYDGEVNVEEILDFSLAKSKIRAKVLPLEGNEKFLEDKPYETIDDLAVIFYILHAKDQTITVTKDILENWGVTTTELRELAMDNSEEEVFFQGLMDTVMTIQFGVETTAPTMDELEEYVKSREKEAMYMLSNKRKLFGAENLLNSKLLEKLEDIIGEYYIIPSSIHEVLLVPKNDTDLLSLQNMVKEINATEVLPEDKLSDNVYGYDRLRKTVINLTNKYALKKLYREITE